MTEAAWDPGLWETLERQAAETDRSYAAFLDYCRMGPGRSLRQLYAVYRRQVGTTSSSEKPPSTRLRTLQTWSAQFHWQDRLAAYQTERARHDQALWEERQRAVRQQDWAVGSALRELAEKVLEQSPQFIKTTRRVIRAGKGEPEREVITLGIDLDGLVKLVKLASELQRQAAEIAPPVQQHQVMSTVVSLTADDLAAAQTLVEQFEDELFGRSCAQPDDNNRL